MGNVVAISPAQQQWSAAQIDLIKRTVAADCNPSEFDLFVTVARNTGLDPFRKQISAIVFNKDKPDKRRMAIITTIDGLRTIAARSGNYRPDEDEPSFSYEPELKGPTNPLGLERARVKIWIADRSGKWSPVTGVAYWDEFAPLKQEWAEDPQTGKRKPTDRMTLDSGGNWAKMGRVMLAKCAEAQALRKAFPEDLSSLYEKAEYDQVVSVEDLPSQQLEQLDQQRRLDRVGANNGILFQFFPNTSLESVALGKVADRVAEVVETCISLKQLDWFAGTNSQPLKEFWARSPSDALSVKKMIETKREQLVAAEQ